MHIALLNDPNNFHTRKWARALQAVGARVTVFSFDADRNSGLDVVQVPARKPGQYSYRDYLTGAAALEHALDVAQVDVVNALNITPFGVWAAKTGKRPLISSALGADLLEYPPKPSQSPLLKSRSWANVEGQKTFFTAGKQWARRQYFRGKVRSALEAADLVTGDNQVLVDAARDWFGVPESKLRLLRWGVEPELFAVEAAQVNAVRERWNIPADAQLVLSPRGAKAIYHADLILGAFARLLEHVPSHVHFLMLSAGYEVAENIRRRAAELEARHPNFHFESGLVEREAVYALWNCVDLFVSAPIYDGYSAAVAEGRYIGAIPVVNPIPGNLELITHRENGWVVDPWSEDGLVRELTFLLKDLPHWKARFQEKNRKWIEAHSLIEANAREFLGWCEQLLRLKAGQ